MENTVAAFEREVSQEQVDQVKDIVNRYVTVPGGLIPALHEVQKVLGFLPRWAQEHVAEKFNIPVSEVNSVISFYSLFSEKPKGKYCIGVCKGTACYVKSSEKILQKLEETLGIEAGDTTADGKYSIEVLRCVGACGLGPVVVINDKVYTRVKPEKVREILKNHEEKEGEGNERNG
jgi:NADH:ubiquinone oxidoreductase subunit E